MQENLFWQIIGTFSSEKRESEYLNDVIGKLTLMSEHDIFQFEILLYRKKKKLCSWSCGGVYALMDSSPDDDHFSDFRFWIIAQGETFYNLFLDNPENVAEEILKAYNEDMPYLQGLGQVSSDSLFKQKGINFTGDNVKDYHAPRDNAFEIVGGYGFMSDLTGDKWETDEDLKNRFPKIFDGTKGEFLRYKESQGL